MLSHADRIGLPAETGATSTANWHAHRTGPPAATPAAELASAVH